MTTSQLTVTDGIVLSIETVLDFFVPGVPVEKGNMIANRFGGGMHDRGGKRLKDWQRKIGDECAAAIATHWKAHGVTDQEFPLWTDPDLGVSVEMVFYLPRPKSVKRPYPTRKHDRDKLARAVHDGLTGVAYLDDGMVVAGDCRKEYADTWRPGVRLTIKLATPPDGGLL